MSAFQIKCSPALVAAEEAFTKSGLNNKVGGSWRIATPHLAKANFYKPDWNGILLVKRTDKM